MFYLIHPSVNGDSEVSFHVCFFCVSKDIISKHAYMPNFFLLQYILVLILHHLYRHICIKYWRDDDIISFTNIVFKQSDPLCHSLAWGLKNTIARLEKMYLIRVLFRQAYAFWSHDKILTIFFSCHTTWKQYWLFFW